MAEPDNRWAPWWVYLIAIVGSNMIKQQFMDGVAVPVNVGVTGVVVALVVLVGTWVWRVSHRSGTKSSSH